jgi:putative cell wall-binding protein
MPMDVKTVLYQNKNQPLVLILTSVAQSPTFAFKLKKIFDWSNLKVRLQKLFLVKSIVKTKKNSCISTKEERKNENKRQKTKYVHVCTNQG